jgi:hypothetical protein
MPSLMVTRKVCKIISLYTISKQKLLILYLAFSRTLPYSLVSWRKSRPYQSSGRLNSYSTKADCTTDVDDWNKETISFPIYSTASKRIKIFWLIIGDIYN